jgi:GntR family transcriptional repressor for pyruvate dehydrogenase complex
MDANLRPVDRSRETVAGEIARKLLAYLLSGTIKPGERIPSERQLAETLGVGRSIVREGLKSLTILGLVDVRQGDGTYLKRTDSELLPQAIEWGLLLGAKRITDLVEARHYLEVLLAGLAADRRDEPALVEMRRCVAVMEHATNADDFVAADIAFHYAVATAAGNLSLLQIMRSVRGLLQVWINRVVRAADSNQPTWEEHVAVLDAIDRGDATSARSTMEIHMVRATERLQKTLDEHGTSAEQDVGGGYIGGLDILELSGATSRSADGLTSQGPAVPTKSWRG